MTLLFLSASAYTQILIDDGPIIINKKTSIAPDYAIQGNSWNHRILTYWFSNGTTDITGTEERTAIRTAMELWRNQTDIRFLEVCDSVHADIIFRWGVGDHGDGYPFDGANSVLAHSFFPPPNGNFAGDVHFDDAETWTLDTRTGSDQPIDLITIAAHEIGHSLGLQHSSVSSALMYAYYSGSHRYLDQDDINGIRSIYGNPGTYNFVDGPFVACSSGATFTVTNDQGATVSWTCSGNVTFDHQTGNPKSFTATGNGPGTIQAILTSNCGNVTLPAKTVWAGLPVITYISGPSSVNVNQPASFTAQLSLNSYPDSYFWTTSPSSGVTIYPDGRYASMSFANSGTYQVVARAHNSCGWSDYVITYVNVSNGYYLSISPNPITTEATIELVSTSTEKAMKETEWDLEVYDAMQTMKSKVQKIKSNRQTLSTSGWKDGVYIVRAIIGKDVISGKLVVKR
ncbi:matrixin family metalloprotease [Aquipluma nitroreducens]|uniref:matrixin family metalloprotease n=1 Tax=Aquipluma nitroreducens TaxID=2010828 RepID=UPI00296EB31B|nr:matrixin family metalloprotease [Aquipluma nitroreducens]